METIKTRKKVSVYIDAANIILSCRRLGFEIDWLQMKIYLEDRFRASKIYYFTGNLRSLNSDLEKLRENDFEIILKEIYYENNKTKANCDVEISHYITKDVENGLVDKVVLLSGDGDFKVLFNYFKQKDLENILIAVDRKSCSKMLRSKRNVTYIEQFKNIIEKRKGLDEHLAS